jgi:signal transduction histidine kinase
VAVISGLFLLDWVLISLSLFNTILMVWLALTVLLTAERRTWGVGLMAVGLAMGALFFVCHTVIIGHELTVFGSSDLEGWWRVGWIPVILAPLLWYVVALWYAGFWEDGPNRLRRRHRLSLVLMVAGSGTLLALLAWGRPLPAYVRVTELDFSGTITIGGMPLLFVCYPVLGVLGILLPIDVLNHPQPSRRMMGDLARQRARPWLLGVSAMLLVVSVLVAAFVLWAASSARTERLSPISLWVIRGVEAFDLVLSGLIALATILLGQAIVSYEIFTGQTLPRRGFFRQWRSAILIAGGMALLVGYTLIWQPLPVFSLLLATLVMIAFYAITGWRSFVNREEFMARLRPFVSGQNLMQRLVGASDDSTSRARTLFRAVCADVLGTSQARLIPLGALAPLAGPPLVYPLTVTSPAFSLPPDLFPDHAATVVSLDPEQSGGLAWAIPLWTERGLIGALLIGPKLEGGLYTREEIEIAQTSAERIIDMLAGEQVARRLMDIERRRFAETRVLDLRTRRVLHDEILPELHTTVLLLSGLAQREPAAQGAIQTLTALHHRMSDLIHAATGSAASLVSGNGLVTALRDMVQEECAGAFDAVTWDVNGSVPALDPLIEEVVFGAAREAVRNAAAHGRGDQPDRPLRLTIGIRQDQRLAVVVRDDGVGLAYRSPAAGDALPAGSGGGLTLHSTMLAVIGGDLSVEAPPGGGTQVVIAVPLP